MQNVSQNVLAQLKDSHRFISRATVIRNGQPISPSLITTGGHLVLDSTAAIRTSGNVEAVDPTGELTPSLATDLISPFTCELAITRGILMPDGSEATQQMGLMRLTKLKISERNGAVTLTASLFDRGSRCQSPMPRPWVIAAGSFPETAIPPLLTSRLGILTFHMTSTQFPLSALRIDAKGSAWDESVKLATSAGCSLYLDRYGVVTMTPSILAASSAYVWKFEEGVNADFENLDRTVVTDDIPNVIVVVGSNPAAPGIRAEAWDADPSSPTYRYGPYGESVRYYDEPRLGSQAQAQAMANSLLVQNLGPGETVEIDAVPNPWLDVGDTISVTRSRIGMVNQLMVVTSIDMPFESGMMHVVAQRSVLTAGAQTNGAPIIAINAPPPPPPVTVATPNLLIDSVSLNPTSPGAGDGVVFSAVVRNDGTAAVPSGIPLGVSFAVDGNVVTWDHTHTTGLAVAATVTITATSSANGLATWVATQGAHVLLATADDLNLISEFDKTDNTFSQGFTVSAGVARPDLVVSSISWTPAGTINPGDHVVFTAVIKNQGTGTYDASGAFGPLRVSFRIDNIEVTWSSSFTGTIAPGATQSITAEHSVAVIQRVQSSAGAVVSG